MARTLLKGLLGVLVAFSLLVSVAVASPAAPGWSIRSISRPTNLAPGSGFANDPEYHANNSDYYQVVLTNSGGAASHGLVTVTDTLPNGLTLASAGARIDNGSFLNGFKIGTCTGAAGGQTATCTTEVSISAGKTIIMIVPVQVAAEPPASVSNSASVSGGGAPDASVSGATTISATPASFGVQDSEITATSEDGSPDMLAGSHPFALTATFDFNTTLASEGHLTTPGDLKNVEVALPPGLVGNTNALPQCSQTSFAETENRESCPESTQIGVASVFYLPIGGGQPGIETVPVENLVPRPGAPAELGFNDSGLVVHLTPRVRPSDYGLTVSPVNTSQAVRVYGVSVTIWGVPYAEGHNAMRGQGCIEELEVESVCQVKTSSREAFLTMPTFCASPLSYGYSLNSWQDPGAPISEELVAREAHGEAASLHSCNQLEFAPSTTIAPETTDADTPTGLTAEVKVPQEGLISPEGLAAADLKNTTVTLPQGVAINPGQAAGLAACQPSEDAVGTEGEPTCPVASKVGTDELETPLLRDKLVGNVYVMQSNPPNLELLVAASADGVNVKLLGHVHLEEATGQLVTTFTETPQLPFTDFKLIFSGGARAALTTPATCGAYASSADFTPWTSPLASDAFSSSTFLISAPAAGASSCAGPLPFSPTLTAGATTDQAGGYTNFSLLLQHADDQQRISTLSFKTPAGLSGMISKVPLCDETDANAGTCPAASQIGHTAVEAGPGPNPLVVPEPGQPPAAIYLTAGYGGEPYGLSIVVPLHVGPFVLATQVVRASIAVDPHTAQLTIRTNPLPQIIDGIPTDLRTINAVIERPEFMFNPTNCSPQSFSGTATAAEGASAPISSHFQVGSCQSLKFQPKFAVSTPGHTTKADGAGLIAKLTYPKTVQGTEANIAKVKVDLPKQLPSRLTTLQKACTSKQFETNPANCPTASKIGYATVTTPVLPVPLQGSAIFVSHGNEAFPSLTMVLQGYGVTIDLVGTTFISHAGITSTTFNAVPDVPFNTFTLTLGQGKYSALAANLPAKDHGNFCGQTLNMPTAFVAQNGAEIHETTKIAVTGCQKAKKAKKKKKSKGTTKRQAKKKA